MYLWVIAYLLYVHLEIENNYPKTRTHSCISFSVKASFRTGFLSFFFIVLIGATAFFINNKKEVMAIGRMANV